MNLTIDQLKNYLGTGLMMQYEGFGENREQIIENWTISREEFLDINFKSEFSNNEEDVLFYFKPICYRLSDLDKFIPELGFVPIDWFRSICERDYEDGNYLVSQMFFDGSNNDLEKMPYGLIQKLFQWHFWPFGDEYFEAGLVIDKLLYNTTTH